MPKSFGSNGIGPSFVGYIGSTKDALLIIQAVLDNRLLAVPRRPHDKERGDLIQSGSVFVFIEEKSGIKRWTDGVSWSPSRILGRFLVYRELDRNGLTASKQAKQQKEQKDSRESLDKKLLVKSERNRSIDSDNRSSTNTEGITTSTVPDRSLVGSLIASYAFKEYGLIKKTMSLTINETNRSLNQPSVFTIHLISYYRAEDVLSGRLMRPINTPELKDIQLSTDLWTAVKESSLGGKIPIEDEAFYYMDQSNPNAAALGFNPSIHLDPQYQQYNQQQQHHQQQQQQQQPLRTPGNPNQLPHPLRQSQSSTMYQNVEYFPQPQFTQPQFPQHQQFHPSQQPHQHHPQGSSTSLPETDYSSNNESHYSKSNNFVPANYTPNGQQQQQYSISSNPAVNNSDTPLTPSKVKAENSPIAASSGLSNNSNFNTPQYNLTSATPRNNVGISPSTNNHPSSTIPYSLSSGNSNNSLPTTTSSFSSNYPGPGSNNFIPPHLGYGQGSNISAPFGPSSIPPNSEVNNNYPGNYPNLPNLNQNSSGFPFPNVLSSNSNYQPNGYSQQPGKFYYDEGSNQLGGFVGGNQYPAHFITRPPN